MIRAIESLISSFEKGVLSRRQLTASLIALMGAVEGAPKPAELKAVTINHVTVRVPDLHRTSDFYQEFFGMPLKQQSAMIHILGVGDSFFVAPVAGALMFGIEQGSAAARRRSIIMISAFRGLMLMTPGQSCENEISPLPRATPRNRSNSATLMVFRFN